MTRRKTLNVSQSGESESHDPMARFQASYLESLLASKNVQKADEYISQALSLFSESGEIAYWSGRVLQEKGLVSQALKKYQRALSFSAQDAASLLQIARLYVALDRHSQAQATFYKYKNLRPQDWSVFLEFADYFKRLEAYEAAANLYLEVYQACPERQDVLKSWIENHLLAQPDLAISCLIDTAIQRPELRTEMALRACSILYAQGHIFEMRHCLEMALEDPGLEDALAYRLIQILMFDFISESVVAIEDYAQRSLRQLEKLSQELSGSTSLIHQDYSNLQIYLQSLTFVACLPYLNLDPKPYRTCYNKILSHLLPALEEKMPRKISGFEWGEDQAHLLFVINSNSPVQAFMQGVFQYWPRDKGRVTLLYTSPGLYETFLQICPEFEHVMMPKDPLAALRLLQNLAADLIFFTEVFAEESLQSLLAHYRLAPVQLTSWLSSGSTGLQHMDYYLSSSLVEQTQDPQRFYSERLILMDELPACLSSPVAMAKSYPRSDYGLPAEGNLYICPHLMFKLHPDFDTVLAEILRQDPKAQVVLLARPNKDLYRDRLVRRLEGQMASLMSRIWFLPKMDYRDFLGLMLLSDVMLDPFYFGGGTTSFEALGLGVPIVTWPGERLHGRVTAAYYRKMGITECIANSPEEYVQMALKLGTDPVWNQRIRASICERATLLFENRAAIHEMADCLYDLIQGRST